MRYSELLFDYNSKYSPQKATNISVNKGKIYVLINFDRLDHTTLKVIIKYFNYIKNKYPVKLMPRVCLVFSTVSILDKLSYIILECILKNVVTLGYIVELSIDFNVFSVAGGIRYSPLLKLANPSGNKSIVYSNKIFLKLFNFECSRYHFRKVIKYDECIKNDKLSKLFDSISYFLKNHNIYYKLVDEISKTAVELIGNAVEHSKSDCLMDIDICPETLIADEEKYYINIVIVNFSSILLGDGIKNKIQKHLYNQELHKNYFKVESALRIHHSFFNNEYDEIDFFNISTFQKNISGRQTISSVGGKGMTTLINTLNKNEECHTCYAMSGDRIMIFKHNLLEYNENWIGFNNENDFIYHKPHFDVLKRGDYFLPGTAFNLSFIARGNK